MCVKIVAVAERGINSKLKLVRTTSLGEMIILHYSVACE